MAMANIHEFSTGITLERQNGQLVSKGFTVGEYMNQTIQNIPQCVERAIANKLFEVSKSSQSPEPTIVGRVVLGKPQGELDWSVVAIVSTGIDNYQRQTDLYRYFLCEGADSLWKIVDWIEDYRNKYHCWPSYNPADIKTIGQPIRHDCGRQKQQLQGEWHGFLDQRSTPIIFQPEPSYDLTTLNAMAEYKAKTESERISWVWNVEAVENPAFFLVIQAANQNTYNSLERMRQSQASQPRPALGSGVDMAGVESAIKGLINGGNIKPEWIQTVVQAKQQNQITTEHWEKIFNDLGANSRSISANIVRLLTLRAIILPKTLPHYLQYLDIKKSDQNPNQQQQTSLEFQSQIRTYRNSLDSFLSEGAISLAELIGYHRRMDFLPAVAWLFDATQPGLWLKYKATFVSKVKEYFKNAYSTRKEYAPLEKLFREWRYQLYTYSYVSRSGGGTRQEPENISLRERLESNIFEVIVQGLFLVIFLILVAVIKPDKLAWLYVLSYAIASGLIRVFLNKKQTDDALRVLGVVFVVFTVIVASMPLWFSFFYQKISNIFLWENSASSSTGNSSTNSTQNNNIQLDLIPEDKITALDKFDNTKTAIQQIVTELSKNLPTAQGSNNEGQALDPTAGNNIVIAALQETLGMKIDIKQYESFIEGAGSDPEEWIDAIKKYQKLPENANNIEKNGYIKTSDPTDTALRKAIQKNQLFTFVQKTRVALNQIVSELKNPGVESATEEKIISKIEAALNNNGTQFNYAGAMNGDPVEIKKLVEAIKQYQSKKNIGSDGIIEPDETTYTNLRDEVKPLL